jgi:cytochrome c553
MKNLKTQPYLLIFFAAFFLISCSHYDQIQKKGKESSANEKSHNSGKDCMSCHHDNKDEAPETGRWWYVAGSLFNSSGDPLKDGSARVELWTLPLAKGEFVARLQADKDGNFYTAKIIDFKGGYYPIVIQGTDTFTMGRKISTADYGKSCNSCHGNNADGTNQTKIMLN